MNIFDNAIPASTNLQNIELDGSDYVIIGEEVERKTGFARGSVMSGLISDLKRIKETQPHIKVAIKNTTEDLDFYSHILRKIPDLYFMFDKEYADKYSKYSTDEWLQFTSNQRTI